MGEKITSTVHKIVQDRTTPEWKGLLERLLKKIFTDVPVYAMFVVEGENGQAGVHIFTPLRDLSLLSKVKEVIAEEIGKEFFNMQYTFEQVETTGAIVEHLTDHNSLHVARSKLELTQGTEDELARKAAAMMNVSEQVSLLGLVYAGDPNNGSLKKMMDTIATFLVDLSVVVQYLKDLERTVTRDPLTGLYNQSCFWKILNREIARAEDYGFPLAVVVVDLDNFKQVNDTFGHRTGDELLKEVARILRKKMRNTDIVARYGGDEFVLILPGADRFVAEKLMHRVYEEIHRLSEKYGIEIGISYGVAAMPEDGEGAQVLFSVADALMYQHKTLKKGNPGQKDSRVPVMVEALKRRRIIPKLQPIVNLNSGKIDGFEVLMRLKLANEEIPAKEFIKLAEDLRILPELDLVMMEELFKISSTFGCPGKLFFNVSQNFLLNRKYSERLLMLIDEHGFTGKIVLEISEAFQLLEDAVAFESVRILEEHGVEIAIDDLGSTPHSLASFSKCSAKYVKLDGRTFKKAQGDTALLKRVQATVRIAENLNMKVIAEWVENEDDLAFAKKLGVTHVQGYLFGEPWKLEKYIGRYCVGEGLEMVLLPETGGKNEGKTVV